MNESDRLRDAAAPIGGASPEPDRVELQALVSRVAKEVEARELMPEEFDASLTQDLRSLVGHVQTALLFSRPGGQALASVDPAPPEGLPSEKCASCGSYRVAERIDVDRWEIAYVGLRQGHLWWFEDGSMYVYYRPTHWKPVPSQEPREEPTA